MGKIRYGVLGATEDDALFSANGLQFTQHGSDYGVARFLYESKVQGSAYQGIGLISTISDHPHQSSGTGIGLSLSFQYRRVEVRRSSAALGY